MSRVVFTIVLVLVWFGVRADFSPDSLLHKANLKYIEGNFDKAAELYQTLVDSGYHNAELYYNLGNAYFKLNKIPYAILNYERAYLLNPHDEDIEFNLEYAKTFTVDRIESLPVFFLTKWYRSARSILTSNGWAWFSFVLFTSTLVLFLSFWFSLRVWLKRLSFVASILAFILFIGSLVFSIHEKHRVTLRNQAIIFQTVVVVKSSPGDTGKDLFILHSGTKVQITKAIGQWVEIRIADGNKGWVQSQAVELI